MTGIHRIRVRLEHVCHDATTKMSSILSTKRDYTLLHFNILPIFKISQYELLIPKCSWKRSRITKTSSKNVRLCLTKARFPEVTIKHLSLQRLDQCLINILISKVPTDLFWKYVKYSNALVCTCSTLFTYTIFTMFISQIYLISNDRDVKCSNVEYKYTFNNHNTLAPS